MAGSVFLISLGVYVATFSRTVQWGDSGELTAAAYVLGVPHAPVYPLLMLLAKLASYVPLGSVAERLNLLNAIFAAGTSCLITVISLRVGCRWLGAALGGLALGFSPIFWSQAVEFEVYSLAALMLAILLLLALRWAESRRHADGFLFTFIYGLSTSAHLLLVAFAPAFVAFLWVVSRRHWAAPARGEPAVPRPSPLTSLSWAIAGLLLGAAIWLYLPLRASAGPPIDFGHPNTWASFCQVVTGGPGRGKLFSKPLQDVAVQLSSLLGVTVGAFYWPGIILALLGASRLASQRREVILLTGLVVVINFLLAANIPVIDFTVYLIPAHLVLALWLGVGADRVISAVRGGRVRSRTALAMCLRRPAVAWGAAALLLLLPYAQVWDNWLQVDLARDREAPHFAHNFLDSAEPGALLVTDWWYVGPLLYARFVERRRPDVDVVPQFSKADPKQRLVLFTEETLKSRAVYAAEYVADCIRSLRGSFILVHIGRIGQRIYRVLEKDSPLPPGNDQPSVRLNCQLAPGCELVGFDLPAATVPQGGLARLICDWRVTGDFSAPSALVVLDAVGKAERIWRERSTLLPLASQRAAPGGTLLFQEEFIAWLPSEAPPGSYRFAIQVSLGPGQATSTISADELTIRVLPRQNGE